MPGLRVDSAEGSASPAMRASPAGVISPRPRELKKDCELAGRANANIKMQSANLEMPAEERRQFAICNLQSAIRNVFT
jgi:hypothetical protein